jgi:hypothetical protein
VVIVVLSLVLRNHVLLGRKFSTFLKFIFGWANWMVASRPWRHWRGESIGIFTAVKMAHLSDDETVAKMGHPIVVEQSDVGHPSGNYEGDIVLYLL